MIAAQLRESDRLNLKSVAQRGLFDGHDKTDCDLKKWWFQFQRETHRLRIPLRVVWGWRSYEQQAQLHRDGVGAPPGRSAHNHGFALDIIHMRRAWDHMPREGWAILGAMGKEVARKQGIDIVWGGDFKTRYDPAHWEIKGWRTMVAVKCECDGGCLPAYSIDIPNERPSPPDRTPEQARSDMLEGPEDIYQRTEDGHGTVYAWVQRIGRFKRSWMLQTCPDLTRKREK